MLEKWIQIGMLFLGTAFVGVGGLALRKVNDISKRMNVGLKDLKNVTSDQIKDGLVETAVREAAQEQTARCVSKVQASVEAETRQIIADKARRAVQDAQKDIQEAVSERISTEVAMIDMDDLRRSARKKAEEKILSKFDGNLDDLLGKFNENLSNVQRIYGGIADAISKTNKKASEIKFSLD